MANKNIWVAAGDGDLDRVQVSVCFRLIFITTLTEPSQELVERQCKRPFSSCESMLIQLLSHWHKCNGSLQLYTHVSD